jgi:hypothetical protein
MKKFLFIASLTFFLFIGFAAAKAETVGEKKSFYVDPSFDLSKRRELTAVLIKITPKAYFYADQNWWNFTDQNRVYQAVSELGQEFQNKIYPELTSVFGPEWNPGIDKDVRIFILIHPMKKSAGGYFNSGDEYPKLQNPWSNEREIIYLNSKYVASSLGKSFLAHEFVHLITFNQKENTYNISEDTWLNEARAEYAPTLLGYDDNYQGSNLARRADTFAEHPSDSPFDWNNKETDYGSANLFIHYLVDQYGLDILTDSLHSPLKGAESIDYALKKNGFQEDFFQVFLDWTIAVFVNDCNYGSRYCYLNKNLRNFRVFPQINFLPLSGRSALTFTDVVQSWTGNWYKVIGGSGDIKFAFKTDPDSPFRVPYIIKRKNGGYIINFLKFDSGKKGQVIIKNFGSDNAALIIIPSVEGSLPPDNRYFSFSWEVSVETGRGDSGLIKELLSRIDELKAEIAAVRAKIEKILSGSREKSLCKSIENNLYYGLRNSQEVRCLQIFLKKQGSEIYPEKLVTGNFLNLTKLAVIRFQEKFAQDILKPLGLSAGTGFVGTLTRKKINELLGK